MVVEVDRQVVLSQLAFVLGDWFAREVGVGKKKWLIHTELGL